MSSFGSFKPNSFSLFIFVLVSDVSEKIFVSNKSCFSIIGNDFFHRRFYLCVFACVLFLIHEKYDMGLYVFFLLNQLHNGSFGISNKWEIL